MKKVLTIVASVAMFAFVACNKENKEEAIDTTANMEVVDTMAVEAPAEVVAEEGAEVATEAVDAAKEAAEAAKEAVEAVKAEAKK